MFGIQSLISITAVTIATGIKAQCGRRKCGWRTAISFQIRVSATRSLNIIASRKMVRLKRLLKQVHLVWKSCDSIGNLARAFVEDGVGHSKGSFSIGGYWVPQPRAKIRDFLVEVVAKRERECNDFYGVSF